MAKWPVGKLCGVLIAVHLVADLLSAWFVEHPRTTPANLAFAMLFCLTNGLFLSSQNSGFMLYALVVGGATCVVVATALFMRLAGYRLVAKSEVATAPVARRRRFERQTVENCGARIAQWLEHSAHVAETNDVPKVSLQ